MKAFNWTLQGDDIEKLTLLIEASAMRAALMNIQIELRQLYKYNNLESFEEKMMSLNRLMI